MAVYTVHIQSGDVTGAKACLIREGFSWPAAIFGPFWLAYHRLWGALIGFIVVAAGLTAIAQAMHLPGFAGGLLSELLAIYLGFEGAQLWRSVLSGQSWSSGNWAMVDVVSGVNVEAAERAFYARWPGSNAVMRAGSGSDSAVGAPQTSGLPVSGPQILGLFPGKGA